MEFQRISGQSFWSSSAGALTILGKLQTATATGPTGKTRKETVIRAMLWSDNGQKRGYLKLLALEEIAREALCWTLAHSLGLPIPQAYYVSANPDDLPGINPGNSYNLAFGLEETGIHEQRIDNRRVVDDLLIHWSFALYCGIFDEWIANGDRTPNNLLFTGNNNFALIDHDDALPAYASVESHSVSQILQRLAANRTESERQALYERAGHFLKRIQKLDWGRIRRMVAVENVPEIRQDMFAKHIEFLRQRALSLPEIVSRSLEIRQTELNLDQTIREGKERYS